MRKTIFGYVFPERLSTQQNHEGPTRARVNPKLGKPLFVMVKGRGRTPKFRSLTQGPPHPVTKDWVEATAPVYHLPPRAR